MIKAEVKLKVPSLTNYFYFFSGDRKQGESKKRDSEQSKGCGKGAKLKSDQRKADQTEKKKEEKRETEVPDNKSDQIVQKSRMGRGKISPGQRKIFTFFHNDK